MSARSDNTAPGDSTFDAVVLGAGNAALTAALAAHDAGASVVILEKAPFAERGGNTRFSGSGFRFSYNSAAEIEEICGERFGGDIIIEPYPDSAYRHDLRTTTSDKIRPDLREVLIHESQIVMRWMRTLGVQWELHAKNRPFSTDAQGRWHVAPGYAIRARDEGQGLSRFLFEAAERRNLPIRYGTAALDLRIADNGIDVITADGTLHARNVIVGTGGFEAAAEARRKYLGPNWSAVKVRGARANTGDMLPRLLALGAREAGEWGDCHATPVDLDAPEYGDLDLTDKTNRLSYPHGITVNIAGKRFFDEGEAKATHTYAKTGRRVLDQPHGVAVQIFDEPRTKLLEARYNTARPVVADTIDDLAHQIAARLTPREFDAEQLIQTIKEYNNSISDQAEFDPSVLDGRATVGITPPKSNWAVAIDTPPFYAYLITTGITFTFGGVAISTDSEVLDADRKPIPGLYAVGELTGDFFYGNYPAGAGLMRGAVFGRRAGIAAARRSHD